MLDHLNVALFLGVWSEVDRTELSQATGLVSHWIPFDSMEYTLLHPEQKLDTVRSSLLIPNFTL